MTLFGYGNKIEARETFTDLGSVSWSEDAIYYLNSKGVINGYGNGKFGPNNKITREQAALMLVRELYPNEKSSTTLNFPDVKEDSIYYNAIAVAIDHDLFEGYPDGTFKPQDPITRAATAKILALAYDLKGSSANFKDIHQAAWAADYINALASNRVTSGYPDGTFKPQNLLTRAEFATFIARAINDNFTIKPFTQGKGYQVGQYDFNAIHPTHYNWNRVSQYDGPNKPKIKWVWDTEPSFLFYGDDQKKYTFDYMDSAPAIGSDGTIYIGNTQGVFYALSQDGSEKWRYEIQDSINEIRTSPIIGKDGTIYFGALGHDGVTGTDGKTYYGGLYALNPNGKLKWRTLLEEQMGQSAPSIANDGTIYVGTGLGQAGGKVYAINSDGKIIWGRDYWTELFSNSEYDQSRPFNTTFVHRPDGTIFAHNMLIKQNGDRISQAKGAYTDYSDPTMAPDGTIYYGTYTNALEAMGHSDVPKWIMSLNTQSLVSGDGTELQFGARISASPAIYDNTIYIGNEDGVIYAVNLNDLHQVQPISDSFWQFDYYEFDQINGKPNSWALQLNGWVQDIVVDQKGVVYASTSEGMVYAINPDGSIKWEQQFVGSGLNAEANNMAYNIVIGDKHMLYVTVGERMYAIGEDW